MPYWVFHSILLDSFFTTFKSLLYYLFSAGYHLPAQSMLLSVASIFLDIHLSNVGNHTDSYANLLGLFEYN